MNAAFKSSGVFIMLVVSMSIYSVTAASPLQSARDSAGFAEQASNYGNIGCFYVGDGCLESYRSLKALVFTAPIIHLMSYARRLPVLSERG